MTSRPRATPNARKNQARRLQQRTGLPYAAALRQILAAADHQNNNPADPDTTTPYPSPRILPTPPQQLRVPSSTGSDLVGTVTIEAHALLDTDPDDRTPYAMLLLTAHINDDNPHSTFAALLDLELHLTSHGIGRVHDLADDAVVPGWAVQISTDHASAPHPHQIAVHTATGPNGTRHNLHFRPALPHEWVDAARREGHIDIAIGPCTRHWDLAPVPEKLIDRISHILDRPSSTTTNQRCRCAHLSADDAVELIDAHAFLIGTVHVQHNEEVPF